MWELVHNFKFTRKECRINFLLLKKFYEEPSSIPFAIESVSFLPKSRSIPTLRDLEKTNKPINLGRINSIDVDLHTGNIAICNFISQTKVRKDQPTKYEQST